ncbi:MAG: carboxylating nicotinate-nucleotide diphosphorylase [Acidimicrobiia bacterium]|nr:carboxylating nicotinate-nucleotide diphosphorylase [Acidimicrobiia bacterium]
MHQSQYQHIIDRALAEDLGSAGDISSEGAIPSDATAAAHVVARQEGTLAGLEVARQVFLTIDPATEVRLLKNDGGRVPSEAKLITVAGASRSLLMAERTALNLLGMMSGVATATARLVAAVAGTNARVADTRKTLPGLRVLQKYAVRMGGGINHRFGLFDAVMIKDNHLIAAGSVRSAVESARSRVGHAVTIEVEVTSVEQLKELLVVGADIVLLDNMSPELLREAVALVDGQMLTEASGGVTPETIRAIAETGVDIISSGWITHSAPNFDLALDFVS